MRRPTVKLDRPCVRGQPLDLGCVERPIAMDAVRARHRDRDLVRCTR